MPRCRRCGVPFERLTLAQTRCPQCEREVAALTKTPEPGFVPAWRQRSLKKDLTGALA